MKCQWLTSLSDGDGLQTFRRLKQCQSAGDGLAQSRLELARNGGGLQVYTVVTFPTAEHHRAISASM